MYLYGYTLLEHVKLMYDSFIVLRLKSLTSVVFHFFTEAYPLEAYLPIHSVLPLTKRKPWEVVHLPCTLPPVKESLQGAPPLLISSEAKTSCITSASEVSLDGILFPPVKETLRPCNREENPDGFMCLSKEIEESAPWKRFSGEFFYIFSILYSTLLHLPPLRFNCVGGSWDRTQDSCDFGIGFQTPQLAFNKKGFT